MYMGESQRGDCSPESYPPPCLKSGINLQVHRIEEAELPQAPPPEIPIHDRIQAVIKTRDHITSTAATMIYQGEIPIESTSQKILIDQQSRPVKCPVKMTEWTVSEREADRVLFVGEVGGDFEEELAR
jgi:hypothetical protein